MASKVKQLRIWTKTVAANKPALSPAFFWRGLAALVIGALLARWTWILFSPDSPTVLPGKVLQTENTSASLFGVAAVSPAVTQSTSTLPDVKLVGVFSGKRGFAVFKLDEKTQRGVAVGEEITPGVTLLEVASDHAVIKHHGTRQRVNLENQFVDSKNASVQPAATAAGNQAQTAWNGLQQAIQENAPHP